MYPPILVLVLALVSFSKQTLALETILQLESLAADDGAEGGGGEIGGSAVDYSSQTFDYDAEDDSGSSFLRDQQQQQQPQEHPVVMLGEEYHQVTSISPESESESKIMDGNFSISTPSNSILEATSEEQAEVTDRIASEEDQISDSEGKVSVAQAFIGDDPQETSSRDALSSRSLDHETADSLQASTILETSIANNFLYTNGPFNESYHPSASSASADESSEPASEDPLASVEEDAQSLLTTTNVPSLSLPEEVVVKPTKPHFDESKISKSELLSRMINDKNLRLPIAFLLDTCNDSLSYSKQVFDATLVPKSPLDVILMRYNSTGITKSISFRNTKSLMEAINSLQPSFENSGRAYSGILRTSQEIPYDSAIFLVTANAATDNELSRTAALTLLKKRIRLYVIWFGDEVDTNLTDQHLDSQTGLHELAYKTGGRVIRFEIDRNFGNNPVLTTLVSESELHGDQSIPIPVPEDVNSLYFKLHGNLNAATLRTPNGD
ncbi:uncharacterized protein LOC129740043 [Uranotaenia lowii]|uniref:uncharacterized protein LOC129740043 n=1 Tax=Uranotaenia lowii TaxID=190385 RepID=UPI002479F402|nr:uncharacterized protein LOC129740043 [Uranotaenia lowii]XP_055587598.1 uncharacterized protein LOC129740043 [Uranotaenia lowii]XP_055587599.1 uncharacterized protein LOC129740043 [Uranotaenia lowii]